MEKTNEPNLKKGLGETHVWAIAFGCIVGWGSFINPGKKFLPNSGVAGTAIAMVLGALVMIVLAFSYAYMVPKYPKAGAEFTFTRKCFGKSAAFLCGWFLVAASLTNVPMNSTAIALIVDGLDGNLNLLQWGFHYTVAGFDIWMGEMILAMAILIFFGIMNIIGIEKARFVSTVLAVLLAVSAFTLCFAGIFSAKATGANMLPLWGFDKAAVQSALDAAKEAGTEISVNFAEFAHSGKSGILAAILATFAITPWAYVGFDTIPQAAEEVKFSYKKMMLVMVVAILFGCFVYTSNNTVAAAALVNWPERVMNGEWVLLVAAEELLGTFGKVMLGIGVSCAVLSGIMGFYFSASRLMYSMARDGYLPAWFGMIDKKYQTPKNAMIFCILVSLSGPILGREALGWFVDMSAIGASIGYLFTSAATLVTLNKNKDGSAVTKFAAVAGIIFSAIFIILQLVPIPGLNGVHFCKESYLMLIIWVVIGTVFYFMQRRHFKADSEA